MRPSLYSSVYTSKAEPKARNECTCVITHESYAQTNEVEVMRARRNIVGVYCAYSLPFLTCLAYLPSFMYVLMHGERMGARSNGLLNYLINYLLNELRLATLGLMWTRKPCGPLNLAVLESGWFRDVISCDGISRDVIIIHLISKCAS